MRRLLIFIILGSLLTTCKKDVVPLPAETTLIAHYIFNGNADDQSKYNNHGTAVSATLTVDSFGTVNSAYSFNNSYIEIPDKEILHLMTNKLTITAWIKPTKTSGTYIVQKANNVTSGGQLTGGGGQFSLDIFPGYPRAIIYGTDNLNPLVLTGTTFIRQNIWQHLAITWDGKNASLYYNGQVEATGTFDKPILVTNGNLYIGAYKWAFPSASFKGTIDNVRIYNRSLTTNEIQDIYNHYK